MTFLAESGDDKFFFHAGYIGGNSHLKEWVLVVLDDDETVTTPGYFDDWLGPTPAPGDVVTVYQVSDRRDLTTADLTYRLIVVQWNVSYKRPEVSALNRAMIFASDYVSNNDTEDVSSGFASALAAAVGKTLVLDKARTYRITDRSLASFTFTSGVHLVGSTRSILDFSDIGASGTRKEFLKTVGTESTGQALASDITAGDTTCTLAAGGAAALSLSRGSIINVSSNKIFVTGGTAGVEYQGEQKVVKSVSGEVVTIYGAFEDSYATGDSTLVKKVTPARDIKIEGLRIVGPGSFGSDLLGDEGLVITNGFNVHVNDCEIEACDFMGIEFINCLRFSAEHNRIIQAAQGASTANQYGIAVVNACQQGYIGHNSVYGGKHGVVQTETGSPRGVTRDVLIDDNGINGTWNAGVSLHTNAERIHVERNDVVGCNSGIELGAKNCSSKGNHVRFLPNANVGQGISLSDVTEHISSTGDTVEGGRFGLRLPSTDAQFSGSLGPIDIQIRDFTCSGASQQAIDITYNDTSDLKKGLIIDGVKTEGIGGVSINIAGTFDEGLIARCNLRRATASGACIVTASITDFEIRDIEYDSNYTVPILGGTRIKTSNIKQWGRTSPLIATIDNGAVSLIEDFTVIAAESGTADTLATIVPIACGNVKRIEADSGDTITVTTSGNIRTLTGGDLILTGRLIVTLVCDGTNYIEQPGAALAFGSTTHDFAEIASDAREAVNVTVTGAVVGDQVIGISLSTHIAGIIFDGAVTSANTVTVVAHNYTGSPINMDSGTLRVTVLKAA